MENTAVKEKTATEYTADGTVHRNMYTVADVKVGGSAFYRMVKRLFDVLAAAVGGLVLLLPMVIIGVLVRLDSPGPALYQQERLGKGGKPFTLYKFRSMVTDAEQDGPRWAEIHDCRCTRLGRVLRATRLDELPQLWNIFKGEMSFVGPRPERACFYEEFETYIRGFHKRMAVKPGLTGLAQVNGGYDLLPEEKIVWDMEYIQRQSLWLDFYCVVKTLTLIFTHEGAR